jgi:hypothetical protein
MTRVRYRPAPHGGYVEVDLDAGAVTRAGHWRVAFAEVARVHLSHLAVRAWVFREIRLEGAGKILATLSLTQAAGPSGGHDTQTFDALVAAILARVPPATPVRFGQRRRTIWLLAALGLGCLGLAGAIAMGEWRLRALVPAAVLGLIGAALLWSFNPFRAVRELRADVVRAALADRPLADAQKSGGLAENTGRNGSGPDKPL